MSNKKLDRLAIIGSGHLAQQIAHHAEADNKYQVVGFYDDFQEKGNLVKNGIILGKISSVLDDFQKDLFDFILIGIGYNFMDFRKEVFENFSSKVPFGKLIHSSCQIDPSAQIGVGSILYPGCIIDMNAIIGSNCLLNLGCTISHDSSVAPHSFLSPNVTIAGFVQLEESVNLGVSTTIIDNVKIHTKIKTGASTTVIRDINQSGLYVGTPAKKIKELA